MDERIDQDLEYLIQELECKELLEAPSKIKAYVLHKISEEETKMILLQQKTIEKEKKKKIFFMGIKLAFSSAASIAVLLLLPMDIQVSSNIPTNNKIVQQEQMSDFFLKDIVAKGNEFLVNIVENSYLTLN